MNAVTELFYPLPDYRRTTWSLLAWWESRRLVYNAVVGGTGLVALGLVTLFTSLPPHPIPMAGLWRGVIVYGVLANVCYTGGWVLELAMKRLWGRLAPDAGPMLFRQGLIFSVGLTLLPVVVAGMSWLVRIGLALVH